MHKTWCIFLIKKKFISILFACHEMPAMVSSKCLNCAFILYRLNSPAAMLTSCSNQPCDSYICNCRQRKAQNVLLNVCVYLQRPFLISGKKGVLRPCWNAQDANAQLGRPRILACVGGILFSLWLMYRGKSIMFLHGVTSSKISSTELAPQIDCVTQLTWHWGN